MRNRYHRRYLLPGWLLLFLGVARRRPDRALAAAYWYLTRRRVRASNRLRDAAATLPEAYKIWIGAVEQREVDDLQKSQGGHTEERTISVLIDASTKMDVNALATTIGSIRAQSGPEVELIVMATAREEHGAGADKTYTTFDTLDPSTGWQSALAAAQGDFILIIPQGAILPPWSLARYREAARNHPNATILFGDEDQIDDAGMRSVPWFKPQWNAELILAQDYMSHACAIATPLARAAAASGADLIGNAGYALLLAASARADVKIRHIPHVLCHMHQGVPQNPATNLRIVAEHVAPMHATVEIGPFGVTQVRWPLPDPVPSVTIIIPTRDRVDLLEACVGSLLRETDYQHYDILIIDNGSIEPLTHSWLAEISRHDRVSVRAYDRPYNYSAINNFGVAQARGQFVCLLNNDTEIISGTWLSELMRYAVKPNVGAVGAKLLYADGSIQHAGVVTGLGNAAGHAHRALPDEESGYFAVAHAAHYASAVTAACLVVERGKFVAVGGLDEAQLQIAYNDVDLCLKLQRAGWHNTYAPQAVLIHHESKSRGLDMSSEHVERYRRELAVLQQRWNTHTVVDPMHHPRLDRTSETYRIRI